MPSPLTASAALGKLATAVAILKYDDAGAAGTAPAADVAAALRSRGAKVVDFGTSFVVVPFPGKRGSATRYVVKVAA